MNISNKKIKILIGQEEQYVDLVPTVYRTAFAITLERVSFIGNTATVVVRVENFLDEARTIKSQVYPDSNTELVITNDTIVDKRDGSYATESTPNEFKQGEFDFFYTQNLASMENMLNLGITRADAYNRFD